MYVGGGVGADALVDGAERYGFVMLCGAGFPTGRSEWQANHSHMANFLQVGDGVQMRWKIYRELSRNIRPAFCCC